MRISSASECSSDTPLSVMNRCWSRAAAVTVRFTPGAHTAWHRHANGQTLHVTDGRGLVQARGGEVIEIRPGDTIYTPPGEWHWHGAAPDHFMAHLAMWEGLADGQDGPETDWGHKSGRGRELRLAVTLRDSGERPERAQAFAEVVESAIEAGLDVEGWRLVTLALVRARTVAEGRGGRMGWAVALDYRARMLADD